MSEEALARIAKVKRTKAKSLDLENLDLKVLPPELAELVWLEKLNIRSNRNLSDLSQMSGLVDLHTLDVSYTQVIDLSPLSGLVNLQTLNVGNTDVSDLSPTSGLRSLYRLFANTTQVIDLSPLSGLVNLQTLNVSNTDVSDLSPMGGLVNLQTLNVSNTQVIDLSPLSGLVNLQTLYADSNQVIDLSPLSGLVNLQTLYASSTQVSDLSPMSGLRNLQTLNVSNTQVSDLSPLSGLVNLQTLIVSNTQVSDLSPLSGLVNLQTLIVSNTQVSDLSLLSGLRNLQKLYADSTQVIDLPPMSGLVNLQLLCIDGNQIKDRKVLERITKLPKIKELIILKEPALDNPSLFSGKSFANGYQNNVLVKAKTYIQSLQEEWSIVYETKLILTGEGEVGKTSVRKKLTLGNDKFKADPNERNSTEGFELDSFTPTIEIRGTQHKATINIWDLGGQDVQLPTHQFFLRHSSLYLFVFKSRLNDEQNQFDKWLHLIKKLSNNPSNPSAVCPIIGVMNQFDKQTKFEGERKWLDEYKGHLKGFVIVNCSELNNQGIDSLEKAILEQLPNIDGFGKLEMNNKWIEVRDDLKKEKRKIISYTRYQKICGDKVPDISAQKTLLDMLDKLGSLLWYNDKSHLSDADDEKLASIIFLDHQWASQAIYQLLMDKEKLIDREASLAYNDLKRYWKDEYWDYHEYFLLLMKRFGFCFETKDKNHYILTPLLSTSRHKEADTFKEKLYSSEKKVLRLRLDYVEDDSKEDVMPRTLTARLIAMRHKEINMCGDNKRLYWRHGVALQHQSTCSTALIEENPKKGTIDIAVAGDKARDYLAVLLGVYEELHHSLGGITPSILIPCNCSVCIGSPNPHYFQKEGELELRLSNGRDDIECKKPPFEKVQIRPLISDVIDETPIKLSGMPYDEGIWDLPKGGDIYNFNIHPGANVGNLAGKTEEQNVETVVETFLEPQTTLLTSKAVFYETHLGKSLIKGVVASAIVGILGSVAYETIGILFVWETTAVSGLLFFLISYSNDPKYRFFRLGQWILGVWLFIGQFLPNINVWVNIEHDFLKGALKFVSDYNIWLTLAAMVLSGLLFFWDFRNNKKDRD